MISDLGVSGSHSDDFARRIRRSGAKTRSRQHFAGERIKKLLRPSRER